MKLELRSIVSAGDLKNERLTLRAKSDLDIGDYLVAHSDDIDGSPSTNFHHTLWFPFKLIQESDLIVVYTRKGTNGEKVLKNGKKAHFFYFELSTPIWSDPNMSAVVLFAPTWQGKPADELKRS